MTRIPLTLNDITAGLRRVIDPADEVVALHSGIWRFGHTVRPLPSDFVERLLDCILDVVGPDRTLLIPAYNSADFPRTRSFDLVRDKPETGALAIAMLKRGCAERTRQPMNSYMVMGPRAQDYIDCPTTTAWGADSIMGLLAHDKARFVTLGEVWHESCSYYHRSEEICGVPYRYYKRFEGELLVDGDRIGRCSETFFVKSLNVHCDDFYAGPESILRKRGLTIDAREPRFILESATVDAIVDLTCEILENDPFYFVQNPESVNTWIHTGMLEEIEALAPEHQYVGNAAIIHRLKKGN